MQEVSSLGQALVICIVLLIFIVVISFYFKIINIKPKATPTSKSKEIANNKDKEKPILYIIVAILFILNIFSLVTIYTQEKTINELKIKVITIETSVDFLRKDVKDIKFTVEHYRR
ncbi:hypothetical protein [Veillonella montpellierensis]|uniref:hypothetical protein n=1 Tax=Veillonella montpellierensis TaxID=187328 RepID=UPI0023FA08FC|nr:hypothetical protein [Veillonella montpellierensis]